MEVDLSTGALLSIISQEQVSEPIVQVLDKKLIKKSLDKNRYRLYLSDGKYSTTCAVFATDEQTQLEIFSVVKMKEYCTSKLKMDKTVIIIVKLEILISGSVVKKKIGDPISLTEDISANYFSPQLDSNAINQSNNQLISPIIALHPYLRNWRIKARVTNKSQLKNWTNRNKQGKLFSFELMDETGEIRCTAFDRVAEKYYDHVQQNKIIYLSRGVVVFANKRYNSLPHNYEIKLSQESSIEECDCNDNLIPEVKYNFVKISEITAVDVGSFIDIVAVCKESSDLQCVTSKRTNRDVKKRDVLLVDDSQFAITLTLWDSQAEDFDGSDNPVVVLKRARVSEFGGLKNLSAGMNTQLKINPDSEESHTIRNWFKHNGISDFKNLCKSNSSTRWATLQEVGGLGDLHRGEYFQTLATILFVRSENAVYKACPSSSCKKKVIETESGMYRCEKCAKEYENFRYRFIVTMNIADFTGHQWVSVFNEEAEKILKHTAQEVEFAMEKNPIAGISIFQEANFKQFVFTCRAKLETYNDEERLKVVVQDVADAESANSSYLCTRITAMMQSNPLLFNRSETTTECL